MRKKYEDFTIIKGSNNVLISVPHTYKHIRNNKVKHAEVGLLDIIDILSKKTNAHFIYTNKDISYDPNYDKNNKYQKKIIKYIKSNNIDYMLDLHGMMSIYQKDIEIGTNFLKNIDYNTDLLAKVKDIFSNNKIKKIAVDKKFSSSGNTICNIASSETGISTLQLEISKSFRNRKNKKFVNLINSLTDIVLHLERVNMINDMDYEAKYDKLLDIKPAYGYKVELGEIPYNYVGLEIEVSVHYERNSYTFIKKMLTNIKHIVKDNGHFVKDGTILGAYSFEIVLNPLSVEDIYRIYSEIRSVVDFSNGIIDISKKSNCGIHLNFNKNDIIDIEKAHKKSTIFVQSNPKYFETNMYKKFKFCWNYEKYYKLQNSIVGKYLWINYLKTKIVEIRNIKADISPEDLMHVLTKFIYFFYDDVVEIDELEDITAIYDSLSDTENNNKLIKSLKETGYALLKLDGTKCDLATIDNELLEIIKKSEK